MSTEQDISEAADEIADEIERATMRLGIAPEYLLERVVNEVKARIEP